MYTTLPPRLRRRVDRPPIAELKSAPHTPVELRHNLRAILGDGVSFSVMVGIGESYLPAFVLALGLGQVAAGLITTIPLLVGSLLQLVSPWAVQRLRSHRRWVVLCATCQAGSFLPLAAAGLWGSMPLLAVFAVAAVYWGAGLGTGPAWNTWVGTLVPQQLRACYFARRTRLSQAGVLVGFVAGGTALELGEWLDHQLIAFACLFVVAAVCRFASAGFLSSQTEPIPPTRDARHVPAIEWLRRMRRSEGRLLVYLLLVQTAAQIAGPYFTPYMLKTVQFSYWQYMALMATSFGMKVVMLPAFGSLAHRYGARRLLWLGGIGIIPVSGFWVFSDNFWFLMGVQVIAGMTWAAYELAMFLLFFESIRAEERTSVLTTFNFANALATCVGSLLGGLLLATLGKTQQTYLLLFGLSSIARLGTVVALFRVPEISFESEPIGIRTLGVRGNGVPLDQPILSSLNENGRSSAPLGTKHRV